MQRIVEAGGGAHGFGSDARKEDEVIALVEQIERDIGPIEVLVFNIGANDGSRARAAGHPRGARRGRRRDRHRVHPQQLPGALALKTQDGILNPAHIAENYWHLRTQPRDAWTFELDLRPYMERW